MDTNIRQLIQAIHNSQTTIVFVAAGAGTQALSHLLDVAGASRTLLEALVPYSEASFNEFLGQIPLQYVSAETACLMAGRAYTRARLLQSAGSPVLGLACTATIVTDRPKRGDHRAYIAAWQPEKLICHAIRLEKGERDRSGEEAVVSKIMLNLLADFCGLESKLSLSLRNGETVTETHYDFEEKVQSLLNGTLPFFSINENGRLHTTETTPQLLLSGSFNPLHDGHLEMAQAASQLVNQPVAFELSAINADKPPLPKQAILQRLAQFAGRHTVYASTAPTFIEKARIYPGTTFVVGYDTALRILHSRFYKNNLAHMLESLSEIRGLGCSFFVAGRADENGRYYQLSDLNIPEGLQSLFHPIPFRKDISSTDLRNTDKKGSR